MSAVQDQFAALTQQSQDVVTGALRTWAESVERLTSQLGTPPASGLPAGLPDPAAIVAAAFDLAEQVLATQRELTLALVRTMTSGLPGTDR